MFGRYLAAILLAGAVGLGAGPHIATAAPTQCPQHFAGGEAPDLVRENLAAKTRALCYSAFALLHSGVSRTPLWVAEHLTDESIAAAKAVKRKNAFHADPNIAPEDRAELEDYKGSGFDRGHMAPAGNMPSYRSQEESFSLANMIPQNPRMNQIIWEWIETAVRNYAEQNGEVYVVTGPIYEGTSFERLNGRVIVPTLAFKAVYDPKKGEAGAYIVRNVATRDHKVVSIDELEQLTGIAVFPELPTEVRAKAMELPKPTARN